MGVYDRQIAQAQRVIKKKGQLVTWIKNNEVINGTQPWKTTPAANPPSFPVYIVFVSGGTGLSSLIHLLQNTSVPAGAPRGLMGAVSSFTPAINDTVIRNGTTLTVKDIDIVQPNGDPILYKITFA